MQKKQKSKSVVTFGADVRSIREAEKRRIEAVSRLRRTIELPADKVRKVVCAICALHNFLLKNRSVSVYAPGGTFDLNNQDSSIHLVIGDRCLWNCSH